MLKDLSALIIRHTVISRRHLTPELAIRVIDQTCPLWKATEEESPFKDPYWAFYWPGGQATASVSTHVKRDKHHFSIQRNETAYHLQRDEIATHFSKERKGEKAMIHTPAFRSEVGFLLDNANMLKDRRVLDIGCGCGAGSIAAAKTGAKRVLANDIDPCAVIATKTNAEINNVTLQTSTENYIGTKCEEFDTILIGDMFYDEEFANVLFEWLIKLNESGKMILIGDPGRHGLTEKRRKHITMLAKYVLPKESCIENHGFTETTLWIMNKFK